jgi:hypothetical protein
VSALFVQICYGEIMKRIIIIFFLILFSISKSFTEETAEELLKNNYGNEINNKIYCGYVDYHLNLEKVLSKFFIDKKNNRVFGTYINEDFGEVTNGIFYKGELKGNNLKIFTTDNYGNGELVVVFDDSFNEFSGTWTEDNKKTRFKWNGKVGEFCNE